MTTGSFLTEAQLTAATTVYQKLAAEHPIAVALISGSQAFGLGHGTSDIDLHVMPVGDAPIESRVHMTDGHPIQVNVFREEMLQRVLDWAADDSEYTSRNRGQADVQDDVRKLAIRLSRGHVLYVDDERKQALARIDLTVIKRRIVAREARAISSLLEDIVGALAINDRDTALWAARLALGHAGEAALAAAGDIYFGPKFLLRRLKRTAALADITPQLLNALDLADDDGNGPRRAPYRLANDEFNALVRWRAALVSYVISKAVLIGWFGELTELAPMTLAQAGPVRDPFHSLIPYSDGLGLAGPDRGFRVSRDAAALWLSLDGTRSQADLQAHPDPAVAQGVAQLVRIGAAAVPA